LCGRIVAREMSTRTFSFLKQVFKKAMRHFACFVLQTLTQRDFYNAPHFRRVRWGKARARTHWFK